MKKRNIHKRYAIFLTCNILYSVFAFFGIPMIPLGFALGKNFLPMGIIGIILVGSAFYALPLLWVGFGAFKYRVHVYDAIVKDHLYSVETLKKQLFADESLIRTNIEILIKKRYLVGYVFDGQKLINNNYLRPNEEYPKGICPHCGGTGVIRDGDQFKCIYCGSVR